MSTGPDEVGRHPPPRPVASSLDRVVRSLGGGGRPVLEVLFSRWSDVVGADVAGHSRPVAMRDGRLTVVVDDPGWATAVRFLEAEVANRVAEVAGRPAIVGVDVVVGTRSSRR